MAIVSKPIPLPSKLDYVPPNSDPHQVNQGKERESWYSLADLPVVKSVGMTANDLCYFNFLTRKFPEINWYLYHKVGCRHTTKDGKNYIFSAADRPGVVYLPKLGPPPPAHIITPQKRADRLNAWFGLVIKAGTMVAVAGIETALGCAVSLDDVGKVIVVEASINRLGLGVGAGLGLSFIFISGISSPSQLNGHQEGDWDFNLSLGENWGKLAQGTAKVKKLEPVIQVIRKLGVKTPGQLKKALKDNPDRWIELIKACRSLKDSLGLGSDREPKVFMFDVPFIIPSGGAEVSVFFGVANFYSLWDSDN